MDSNINTARCVMPYPEEVECKIDTQGSVACCFKYNRFGSIFAVGCLDGRIFLYNQNDIRKSIARQLTGHTAAVNSLSFSRDSRSLVSASHDSQVIIWDIEEGCPLKQFKINHYASQALFNPRNSFQIIIHLSTYSVQVYDLNLGRSSPLAYAIPGSSEDYYTCVNYERKGRYIVCGSAKGRIVLYDAIGLHLITHIKQGGNQGIRQIWSSRKGDYIITNNSDKIIRCYEMSGLEKAGKGVALDPCHKYHDTVDRRPWAKCAASGTMDFVVGLAAKDHALFYWERSTGAIVKRVTISSGSGGTDLQWHPTKPIVATVYKGEVFIWKNPIAENWSGFAPDFTEIEKNIRHKEKESEFDDEDEDAEDDPKKNIKQAEEIIDIETMRENPVYCSSDEDDVEMMDYNAKKGDLWFLPAKNEVDPTEDFDERADDRVFLDATVVKMLERAKRDPPKSMRHLDF
uniref:WD_REPEATS_REGION domain-containing protein n=1 Tax=Rhabditophanes sp. KR3021 TaxID=114890 RepID=A0AC35U1Y4_9BILA